MIKEKRHLSDNTIATAIYKLLINIINKCNLLHYKIRILTM